MPPKRQHYVPQFYLDNFTVRGGARNTLGFWVYDKSVGEPRWQTPINTAVESYFYTVTRADGGRDHQVETLLAECEGGLPSRSSGDGWIETPGRVNTTER
jgi:hypothetical protein